MIIKRKSNKLWDYLGSAWDNFENKEDVETFWDALASGIDKVRFFTYDIQRSKSLKYMPETLDIGPITYTIIYSGLNQNTTSIPSGLFEYPIDEWTYSIPQLVHSYKYALGSGLHTYVESIDYTVSGYNHIAWKGSTHPAADPRYPSSETVIGYAEHVYQVNPVLMNMWARALNFSLSDLVKYSFYKTTSTAAIKYRHLRYLVWALSYKKLKPPSIKNLHDAFGIARGLPFAYYSGILSSVDNGGGNYTLTVGAETYTINGLTPVPNGPIGQFDLLVSGLSLWDYNKRPASISAISAANTMNRQNLLLFEMNSSVSSITSYSTNFFNTYISGIMPEQVEFYIKTPGGITKG